MKISKVDRDKIIVSLNELRREAYETNQWVDLETAMVVGHPPAAGKQWFINFDTDRTNEDYQPNDNEGE
jgi:hypothetical protein